MEKPKPPQARQSHIDALKFLAAQFIVLHHFACYGPLSEGLRSAAPVLADWLYNEALAAVHAFLALGGFLAARSLCSQGLHTRPWAAWVAERWARLMPPYAVALLLAMLSSAVARHWLSDDFIPAPPTLAQVLAHLGFAQDLVGVDSLTAGAWYVAIDFQLFAVLALLLRCGQRLGPALVLALVAASLLYFNRDPELDTWAIYFFGSYGLGAAAWLASRSSRAHRWLTALALLGLLALMLDFRERLLLALLTALGLGLWERRQTAADRTQSATGWPLVAQRLLAQQGAASFALFLVHFPVFMLVSAWWADQGLTAPGQAVATLGLAWLASMLAALAFHRWVEQALGRWLRPWTQKLSAFGAARRLSA